MKDRIVAAIHRDRAKIAKRFNYDVSKIGNAIRQSEIESGNKFIIPLARKKKKTTRRSAALCP